MITFQHKTLTALTVHIGLTASYVETNTPQELWILLVRLAVDTMTLWLKQFHHNRKLLISFQITLNVSSLMLSGGCLHCEIAMLQSVWLLADLFAYGECNNSKLLPIYLFITVLFTNVINHSPVFYGWKSFHLMLYWCITLWIKTPSSLHLAHHKLFFWCLDL